MTWAQLRAQLVTVIQEASLAKLNARQAGDAAKVQQLDLLLIELARVMERWRRYEREGKTPAPYVGELQLASRKVALTKLAADKGAETKAREAFTATGQAMARYAEAERARESAPSALDKLLATFRQGGMVITLLALGALALFLRGGGGGRRSW